VVRFSYKSEAVPPPAAFSIGGFGVPKTRLGLTFGQRYWCRFAQNNESRVRSMGNVVQLKPAVTDDRSSLLGYLDAYRLALCDNRPAIEAAEAQIENNLRTIASIMRSTESSHAQEITLLQLNNIRSQLHSLTTKLSDAKGDLLGIRDIIGSRS
jgi:hypothetical protein